MAISDLGRRSVSASLWFMVGSGGQLVLQFALFVVLARILGPRPFGIVSIAALFIDMLALIGKFGIIEVLVQRQELSKTTESTAFWVTAILGLLASVLIYVAAPYIAELYGLAELDGVLRWLSLTCFFNAICAVYEAQLRRELRFKELALRNLVTAAVGYIVAIALAYSGWDVYSVVVQRIVVVLMFWSILVAQTRWLPAMSFDVAEGRQIAKSGLSIIGISLLGIWNQKIIDLIIGLFLGPVALGYLRIAWRGPEIIQQISIQALIPVAMSSFSRLADDAKRFNSAYFRVVNGTAFLMYPLFTGLIVFGSDFVHLVFGEKWEPSVLPMQILAVTGFIAPLFYYSGIAMIAKGRNQLVLMINAFEFLVSAACAAIMARQGLEWAAASNVVRSIFFVPVALWFARQALGLPMSGSIRACWRPAAASVALAVAAIGCRSLLPPEIPSLLSTLAAGLCGVVAYAVVILWLDRDSIVFVLERSPASRLLRLPPFRR